MIVLKFYIIAFTLKRGETYLEYNNNSIKYRLISGKYKIIQRVEIIKMGYFDWGRSPGYLRTLFIKTKDYQTHLPIEGLNVDKFEILKEVKEVFNDKFDP